MGRTDLEAEYVNRAMRKPDIRVVTSPSEEAHWYALRVRPQAEYLVAYMLRRHGARTFVPTTTRFRRRTRYVNEKAEFAHPEFPSLVFVGFDGEPAWYYLLRNPLILGVEGDRHGEPGRILEVGKLLSFFARTNDGCLAFDAGLRMVYVPGRGMLRGPTNQVKVVSHRKRASKDKLPVVHSRGATARLLASLLPQPVRMAA